MFYKTKQTRQHKIRPSVSQVRNITLHSRAPPRPEAKKKYTVHLLRNTNPTKNNSKYSYIIRIIMDRSSSSSSCIHILLPWICWIVKELALAVLRFPPCPMLLKLEVRGSGAERDPLCQTSVSTKALLISRPCKGTLIHRYKRFSRRYRLWRMLTQRQRSCRSPLPQHRVNV
jgi:hypothetical protein